MPSWPRRSWKAGQAEEGLALIAEAEEFVTKTGERQLEAEVHRLKGELLLARSPSEHAAAEAAFREALEVAHRQSAKSYELRAATSLAHLWQRQGREEDARELLAPVYELVHRRLRHAGPEGREGTIGSVGLSAAPTQSPQRGESLKKRTPRNQGFQGVKW